MMIRTLAPFLFIVITACGPVAPKSEQVCRTIPDIEYAKPDGLPQLLDLYLPTESKGRLLPVVVWVHGGGWLNGKKEKPRAEYLAEHGFAVASINYRLTQEAIWPAQIDDCRESVRWLRSHAKDYGLDPEKIGVWGSSAGGHLVALMGTLPYPKNEAVSSRVQAVCDWFGPTELLAMPPNNVGHGRTEQDVANSNGAKLLGCTVKDCPELARQASALDQVSGDDAPFLIMHGELDPGVPLSQSIRFYHTLKANGVQAELVIVKDGVHGGPQFATDEAQQRVLAFFNKWLK